MDTDGVGTAMKVYIRGNIRRELLLEMYFASAYFEL